MSQKRFVFKIMVIGDPSVGKTSLIRRFVENRFSEDYITTIGVDFLKKDVLVKDEIVTLVLWDVAGQAKYANFKKYYYQGAVFVIIVFDLTKKQTYYSMSRWLADARELIGPDVDFAIFANKADLKDQCEVFNYNEFNNEPGLLELMETSAKTGRNVDEFFTRISYFLAQKVF